jgi:type III secretion system YscI/HrpB-like protein
MEVTTVAQASLGPDWVNAPVTRAVPESDAARFADLMRPAPDAAASQSMLGQAYDAISSISDSQRATRQRVGELAQNAGDLTSGAMLAMQWEVMNMSLTTDLVSKVVSKVVQHVDQITKLQ